MLAICMDYCHRLLKIGAPLTSTSQDEFDHNLMVLVCILTKLEEQDKLLSDLISKLLTALGATDFIVCMKDLCSLQIKFNSRTYLSRAILLLYEHTMV